MKYLLYLLLFYVLLPLNNIADFIMILLFIITITEHGTFALICAFIAGLLVDLYYPSMLGLNILLFLILVQVMLITKNYVTQTPIIIFGLFAVFFLCKIALHHIVVEFDVSVLYLMLTLVCFFPVYGLMNRIMYRSWMRT